MKRIAGPDVRFEEGETRGESRKDPRPCAGCGRSYLEHPSGRCRSCRKTAFVPPQDEADEEPGSEPSSEAEPAEEPAAEPETKETPVIEAVETKPRFSKVDEELEELEAAVKKNKKTRPCGCAGTGRHRNACSIRGPLPDRDAKPAKAKATPPPMNEEAPSADEPAPLEIGPEGIEALLVLAELRPQERSRVIARALERWS